MTDVDRTPEAQSAVWRIARLGELGRIVTGRTPKAGADAYGDHVPFVTPTDMDGRRYLDPTGRGLSEAGFSEVRRASVSANAVMVSCIGSDMGKVAVATQVCVTNQQINSLVVDTEDDALFVYYNLSMRKQELQDIAGGSAQPILNKTDFGLLTLELPPPPMQRAIVRVLTALDDKVELNRRMNRTLEELAQKLFKSWFVDFDPVVAKSEGRKPFGLSDELAELFPTEFEESASGPIPAGWRVASIYEVADVIYGAPFASKHFNTDRHGIPLVRIRDLQAESPGIWTPEVHPKGYLIRQGDIVVGMDGEFRAYLWGGPDAWLNQRVCVFVPKKGFPAAFLHNTITPQLAEVEATETATTVIHLGKNDIDRFVSVVPHEPVLKLFKGVSDPWYERIVANKRQSRSLAAMRDLLLPKLLTGELSVQAAERVVEAAL